MHGAGDPAMSGMASSGYQEAGVGEVALAYLLNMGAFGLLAAASLGIAYLASKRWGK
jgi:hypothetical protein